MRKSRYTEEQMVMVICAIDFVGDIDTFRFDGAQGDNIILQVTAQGSLTPCLELFDSQSSLAKKCHDASSQRIDLQLASTGQFTILVSSTGLRPTGGYSLILEKVAPPSGDARPLYYGGDVMDEINPTGDFDVYYFPGNVGDVIVLQVTSQGDLTPCLELRDPDNTPHTACRDASLQRIDYTLPATGIYTAILSSTGLRPVGPYDVTVQCVAGLCQVVFPPDLVGCLQLQGAPVANAVVAVDQKAVAPQETVTDSNGCYRFATLVSGKKFKVNTRGPKVP
jgi:hypothetical protein